MVYRVDKLKQKGQSLQTKHSSIAIPQVGRSILKQTQANQKFKDMVVQLLRLLVHGFNFFFNFLKCKTFIIEKIFELLHFLL